LGLIIGEVSGKGIAAALLMANLQASLRSQSALAFDQPEALLKSVNRLFYGGTIPVDRIVTICDFVERVYLPWVELHKRPSTFEGLSGPLGRSPGTALRRCLAEGCSHVSRARLAE
jgi:hypothetical protein